MYFSRYAARLNATQPGAPPVTRVNIQREDGTVSRGDTEISGKPGKFPPSSVRFTKLPLEPEDARLTGGTRSLSRRLLGLNLAGSLARPENYRGTTKGGSAA
jgi:hypothetical protein